MRAQTYFRLALFTPFILWVIGLLITILFSAAEMSTPWDVIFTPIAYYTIGIILWLIPYLILAVGLWIWSKNRTISNLRNAGLMSPFLFFLLLFAEAYWAYLSTGSLTETTQRLPELAATVGALSLVFGYLCVGIAFGVFKFLQARNFIAQEAAPER